MICFCINNNRGSHNHNFSIITPSVFLVPPSSIPLSISFLTRKVCILLPKQAIRYMYWRSHSYLESVSFVRIICWDIDLTVMTGGINGRKVHSRGWPGVVMVGTEPALLLPHARANMMK